jgi:hypothetical protein
MTKRLTPLCGFFLLFGLVALASDYEKKTVVTLNEPVIVAGVKTVTLQPGTYVLKLMNHASNRNIVEIFNERQDHLFALVLAIPNYRLEPKDKTVLNFWETPEGNPVALRAWFYPGDRWGQEFVYPKGLAARIARQAGETVLAAPPVETETQLEEAPVTQITKAGEEQPFVPDASTLEEIAGAYPAEPVVVAAAAAAEAAAPEVNETPVPLPATGSPYSLMVAVGVLLTVAGIGLKWGTPRLR